MAAQITLYTAKICPYAQRAEIALAETGLPFKRVEIDLKNKPEWYPKVNPRLQVPAITYGGADHPPEAPSPDSEKIAESLVLVDFFNDLAPNHPLLPTDPVLRAKARYFVEAVGSRFNPAWFGACARGESCDKIFEAIESLQALLPATGKYAVGDEFTIADVAAVPFFARMEVTFREDIGAYAQGEGPKAWKTIVTEPRFARWREYYANLKARESFKKTFDEEFVKRAFAARFADLRKP
ncbi:thioredoxin-like protein [Schizophyllum amplum]|uniref:Thioredoxin-like protein n=1 Tax=Schizophyllum amplum TaxID=97359 RepID=A0A550C440_9AGAR|nr:thioredoxin-like protein [Auriculariopsis ampla]